MAYVMFFLAMRSGNWPLRMANIKLMVPLFSAFDHNTYQKIIGQHIVDMLNKSHNILTMFKQGVFVLEVGNGTWWALMKPTKCSSINSAKQLS